MVYVRKTERGLLGLLLVITMSTVVLDDFSTIVYILVIMPTMIIIALFVSLRLTMDHIC